MTNTIHSEQVFEKVVPVSQIAAAIFLLSLVIFACYSNSLLNGFVSDDYFIIELNQETLSFESIFNAFTSVDRLVETDVLPYYRPLNRLSYLVDKFFFGLNPTGYHAVNIMLHLICSVLVYLVLLRVGCGSGPSLGAAMLFGVHPVNSEAVNFISARNTILSTIFVLGSFLAFLRGEESKKNAGYILSGVLFFFGMLCKETTLMLIPFLILFKMYRQNMFRNLRNILKSDTSFIVFHVLFLAAYLLLRFFAVDNNYNYEQIDGLPARMYQVFYIIPTYFSLIIAPFKLVFHPVMPEHYDGIFTQLMLKWVVLIGALVCVIWKRDKMILFGLTWFTLNFIPIVDIVPVPNYSISHRYLYLPLIGILAILSDGLYRVPVRTKSRKLAPLTLVLLVLFFGILTHKRNFDWQDNLSLTRSIIDADPSSAVGHSDYGYQLFLQGNTAAAIKEWELSLSLGFRYYEASWALYYLGALKFESQDFAQAERYFSKAIKIDPNNPASHYALATALSIQGRAKEADQEYKRFRQTMGMYSLYLLSDVNSNMSDFEPKRSLISTVGQQQIFGLNAAAQEKWNFSRKFKTGTELYFEIPEIQKKKGDITIRTRHLLAKSDKSFYAFSTLRFPLGKISEARFDFDVNCQLNIYKMVYAEFRDGTGNVLGRSYPEKEAYVWYQYLLPQTPMRLLTEQVCRTQISR